MTEPAKTLDAREDIEHLESDTDNSLFQTSGKRYDTRHSKGEFTEKPEHKNLRSLQIVSGNEPDRSEDITTDAVRERFKEYLIDKGKSEKEADDISSLFKDFVIENLPELDAIAAIRKIMSTPRSFEMPGVGGNQNYSQARKDNGDLTPHQWFDEKYRSAVSAGIVNTTDVAKHDKYFLTSLRRELLKSDMSVGEYFEHAKQDKYEATATIMGMPQDAPWSKKVGTAKQYLEKPALREKTREI